jgi:pimeloyl-ACP methyl ester carboxylesterase
MTGQEPCPVPEWFTRAVDAPVQSRSVEVRGTPIHYLSWNPADLHKPGLLFVHGFRAHARWWSFIAPFFLSRFRVAAMDFAGMGDSGARALYTPLGFAEDILAVVEDARFDRTTLIGHSFGGGRVLRACAENPRHITRAVVIDSDIPLEEAGRPGHAFEPRPKKIYATLDAARARFRLVPAGNRAAPYILDFIARHSLKQVDGGWTWKFDERFRSGPEDLKGADVLSRIELPVTYVYGDASAIVSRSQAHDIVAHLRNGHGPIAIPQSHHHVMLDQPLSLVAALRGILLGTTE